MRHTLVLVFILSGLNILIGQKKARDFTVVTTDRKTIELYKDYLNKGKVVVLKIMFVDCPPCNEIAPSFSALYKKYGSGQKQVEFIELSNKTWDADPAMIGYKIKYDLPCPSVSNDGGSVRAAELYSDNYYGPFFGTPTFIVIKPNGDLEFDPRGFSSGQTAIKLDTSISQALRSINVTVPPKDTVTTVPPKDTIKPVPPKDTIKPVPPKDTIKPAPVDTTPQPVIKDSIILNGKLTLNSTGLGLVKMNLRWNGLDHLTSTDLFGNFSFKIPDTAIIKASANLIVDYTLDYNAEVSTADLILIQKHILGITKFTDFKQTIAADVDQSGDIDVLDLLDLRKLILGIYDKLPASPSIQFLWKNPNNFIKNLSGPITYSDLTGLKGKSFTLEVVKIGNVN
ncbi:MAG: redoxin domain-containing protein [Saprospiraceae bacterium]